MDLQVYYRKIREIEATIAEAFPVIVSLATPDGGKAGTTTETPRALGARMIAEGLARPATAEEAAAFRAAQAEAKKAADQTAAASRVQLTVLSTAELSRLRGSGRTGREQG